MFENIPLEMRSCPNWVCWDFVCQDGDKPRKVPVDPRTGRNAKSNEPGTWGTFDEAVNAAGRYSGIGFQFTDSPFFGVDLDSVGNEIADMKNDPMADNVVTEFLHTLSSYAEFSTSGNGIHIICRGTLPPGGRRKGRYEFYETGRYFIMTGNVINGFRDIKDCTESVKPLHEKYVGGGTAPTTGIRPVLPLHLADAEIIRLASTSKQQTLFNALWAGRWEDLYPSHSEADLALCNILAFWTGRDEAVMDRLFRQSGLHRDKWNQKMSNGTYGASTVRKAAMNCNAVYEPRPDYAVNIGTASPQEQESKEYTPYSFDDTGNAQRFVDRFGDSVRYNYTAKSWMYYDQRRWVQDDGGEAKRMADEVILEAQNGLEQYLDHLPFGEEPETARKNYLKHVKSMRSSRSKVAMLTEAQHLVEVKAAAFDTQTHRLNVLNGTLDLAAGELLPHDRADMISKLAACEYTNKTDTPRWNAFLDEIFDGDRDLVRYIQKAVGYSMTGSIEEHVAFICYGTGRNGKSTFLDLIGEMLGDYAINIQPETIMVRNAQAGPTSDVARLKGARFVTTVEPNEGVRLNEGLLKQLTGGDRVTASKKYENEFEFHPEFKLWMGTNHKPVIRGTDLGIWSRIQLIPFKIQIPEEQIDRKLKFKLREEMPGILAWGAEGCRLWRREGLRPPMSVLDASKEYRGEMDVLAAFIEGCCVEGQGETDAGELFRTYIDWAKESNEHEMSSTKFGREMGKKFEKRVLHGAKIYVGIKLRNQEQSSGFKIAY